MGADAQPDPLQIGGVCNCQLERSPAYVVAAQGGGSPRTVASRVYRTDVRAIPGSARRGHCNDGAAFGQPDSLVGAWSDARAPQQLPSVLQPRPLVVVAAGQGAGGAGAGTGPRRPTGAGAGGRYGGRA